MLKWISMRKSFAIPSGSITFFFLHPWNFWILKIINDTSVDSLYLFVISVLIFDIYYFFFLHIFINKLLKTPKKNILRTCGSISKTRPSLAFHKQIGIGREKSRHCNHAVETFKEFASTTGIYLFNFIKIVNPCFFFNKIF